MGKGMKAGKKPKNRNGGGAKDMQKQLKQLQAMQADGADTFVEFGPGKTLAGLVKRTLENVRIYNIENMETLGKAEEIYG